MVDKKSVGQRIDKFLSYREGYYFSRTKIKEFIRDGKITIRGNRVSPNYKVKDGDIIEIIVHNMKLDYSLEGYPLDIDILYEDDDIIGVNKPAGLVVHPPTRGYRKTLVNALIYMGRNLADVSSSRPGIVHRLDKNTSGAMVVAKSKQAYINLVNIFKRREVKKKYIAVVWGNLKKDDVIIDLPLARSKRNRLTVKISFIDSKSAYTTIKVLKRLNDKTVLFISPLTGRMHQIRVHLNFLGFPILGDKVYGIKDGYDNMFLHSYRLEFFHPCRKDKYINLEAPLPDYFKEFVRGDEIQDFASKKG